jgi:IS1 family transposase
MSDPKNQLWIQYAYDDETDAPVIQTADSEDEARECDDLVMDGCCWYCYNTVGGKLINGDGPHYFNQSLS